MNELEFRKKYVRQLYTVLSHEDDVSTLLFAIQRITKKSPRGFYKTTNLRLAKLRLAELTR